MGKANTSGFKEIREEVAIAAFSALFTTLITWAIDELKALRERKSETDARDK